MRTGRYAVGTLIAVAILLGLLLIRSGPGHVMAAEPPAEAATGDEAVSTSTAGSTTGTDQVYFIQKGDTLWDISQGHLRDPFLWPKLWQANQRIKNPDLIFPGNQLVIPAELAKPRMVEAGPGPTSLPPDEVADGSDVPGPIAQPVTPRYEETRVSRSSDGWLRSMSPSIRSTLPESAAVFGPKVRGKVIMAESELIYILPRNAGPFTPGQRLMIYRTIKKVRHPITGNSMGMLVRPLAIAEVTLIDRDVTEARIWRSVDYVEKGDFVAEFETMAMQEDPGSATATGLNGVIAEVQEDRLVNAGGDIVFLDLGRSSGLKSGDRLTIVRSGESVSGCCAAGGKVKLPDDPIGEVKVLSTQDNSATAVIVQAKDPVNIGDRVFSKR